ncbi:MAG: hypothetical protein HYU66_12285 [Armatimonadetes bacterium]|nr:hypothetical protein [Armatimonadota bacterium]
MVKSLRDRRWIHGRLFLALVTALGGPCWCLPSPSTQAALLPGHAQPEQGCPDGCPGRCGLSPCGSGDHRAIPRVAAAGPCLHSAAQQTIPLLTFAAPLPVAATTIPLRFASSPPRRGPPPV